MYTACILILLFMVFIAILISKGINTNIPKVTTGGIRETLTDTSLEIPSFLGRQEEIKNYFIYNLGLDV